MAVAVQDVVRTERGWSPVVGWLHRSITDTVDMLEMVTSMGTLVATPDSCQSSFSVRCICVCSTLTHVFQDLNTCHYPCPVEPHPTARSPENHLFFRPDGTAVAAGLLQPGDQLAALESSACVLSTRPVQNQGQGVPNRFGQVVQKLKSLEWAMELFVCWAS